jgi:hypothetical protein
MKQFTLRWIALSLLCTALSLDSKASGGEDWYTGFDTYYLQQFYPKDRWFAYQLETNTRYYQDWRFEETKQPYFSTNYNADAWRKYLNIPASVSSSDIIKQLDIIVAANGDASKAKIGSVDKAFLSANSDIKQYLALLAKYYALQPSEDDEWNYEAIQKGKPLSDLLPVIDGAKNGIATAKDNFMKWRFFHLLLRTYHKHHYFQECVDAFNTHYNKLSKDNGIIQAQCEGYMAGACLRTNQQAECALWCARSWQRVEGDGTDMSTTYMWSKRNWQDALALCQNLQDSTAVLSLDATTTPQPRIEMLEQLVVAGINDDLQRLLWMREVQKIDVLGVNDKNPEYDYYSKSDDYGFMVRLGSAYYLEDFEARAQRLMGSANNNVKSCIANGLAYLFLRRNDLRKAKMYLAISKNYATAKIDKLQLETLEYVYRLRSDKDIADAEIVSMLKSLAKFETPANVDLMNYLCRVGIAPYLLEQGKAKLATWAYMFAQGNRLQLQKYESIYAGTDVFAEQVKPDPPAQPLFYDAYDSDYSGYLLNQVLEASDLQAMQAALDKRQSSNALETFFAMEIDLPIGARIFNGVLCRRYALMQEWDKALAILPNAPLAYQNMPMPNPVNFKVDHYMPDNDLAKPMMPKAIFELAKKLKTNADAGNVNDCYLYGMLLYNTSFYGIAYDIVDDHYNYHNDAAPYYLSKVVDVDYNFFETRRTEAPMSKAYEEYFYLWNAKQYLEKAQGKLANDELNAQCLFMLAKCWSVQGPVPPKDSDGYADMETPFAERGIRNPYFKELNDKFASTKVVKNIESECSYYRIYLGGN